LAAPGENYDGGKPMFDHFLGDRIDCACAASYLLATSVARLFEVGVSH
jgi:hypothetical protein